MLFKENKILLLLTIVSFLTPFTGSSINLALPAIGREFHADAVMLNWGVEAFLTTTAALLLPAGRLSDLWGRRKLFTLGVAVFVAVSIITSMVTSMEQFVIMRAAQGIANALIFSNAMVILTLSTPVEKRGWAIGVNAAAVYLGLSMGPVLGGFLNHQFGWRSIFYFIATLSSIALVMIYLYMKEEWHDKHTDGFDGWGAFLYVTGVVVLLYGLAGVVSSPFGWQALVAGIVLLAIFCKVETSRDNTLLNLRLFSRNRVFAMSNLAGLINYSASFSIGYVVSIYLQLILGFDSQWAGFVLLVQPVVMALAAPRTGRLSDFYEVSLLASVGMFISSLGIIILIGAAYFGRVEGFVLGLIVAGFGFALFGPPNNNAIMSSVSKKDLGAASSILGTARLVGQAMSVSVVSLVFSLSEGGHTVPLIELPKETLSTILISILIILAVICLAGIIPSRARGSTLTED